MQELKQLKSSRKSKGRGVFFYSAAENARERILDVNPRLNWKNIYLRESIFLFTNELRNVPKNKRFKSVLPAVVVFHWKRWERW